MSLKVNTYNDIRNQMKPGDVIAFGGKDPFSEIIKMATRADVSHLAVIHHNYEKAEGGGYINEIIESTVAIDSNGVSISQLSKVLNGYNGNVWWLPIRKDLRRAPEDLTVFYDFLKNIADGHVKYDLIQAVKSAFDLFDGIDPIILGPTYNKEDYGKFFCSELVAAALEKAGVVPEVNASEVTPIDLCRWNIYEEDYYQLLSSGHPTKIKNYNKLDPKLWNV
ncbi:hypothetical protein [Maridesulfovibrio frigidus]|uniref:hypothetical protein n=1 Tax=Maridesulfovibrio frigidus TaxID=340956 RepID=UPI0004E1E090|nr:hypothetical protein [Maridesulfovibrio frigidus]